MTLVDEARALASVTLHGPDCSVRRAQQKHPKHADDIAEMIRDRAITSSAAETVFTKYGIDISDGTIQRHRLNRCVNCRKHGVVW